MSRDAEAWSSSELSSVRRKRSMVVAIGGEPAVGKTTAARHLAQELGGVAFDTDMISAHLRDAAMSLLGMTPEDVDSDFYKQEIRPAVYQCLVDTAAGLCEFGVPVAVSAPFHPGGFRPEAWESFSRAVGRSGGRLVRVHVAARPDVVLARMRDRGAARDHGKIRMWDSYRAQWELGVPDGVVLLENSGDRESLRLQVVELAALLTE